MINQLHSLVFRPSLGWDPVSDEYAQRYSETTREMDFAAIDDLEHRLGSLRGKKILDLGGGPGWHSIEFARRGGDVTWWDVSKHYRRIAEANATKANVRLNFQLDFLENIAAPENRARYDLIFNRVCWYYCQSDESFARALVEALVPGGLAYVETMNSDYYKLKSTPQTILLKLQRELYDRWGYKVGHPYAPSGTLERIFLSLSNTLVRVDYSEPGMEKLWLKRI